MFWAVLERHKPRRYFVTKCVSVKGHTFFLGLAIHLPGGIIRFNLKITAANTSLKLGHGIEYSMPCYKRYIG
jgi:hypothetical protein